MKSSWSVVAALLYGALCVAILLHAPVVDAGEGAIPDWLGLVAVMIAGPAALLSVGIGAINWFLAVLTGVAVCAGLSRLALRRYPESELFIAGLIGAAVMWAAVPVLLLMAFGF